MSATLLELNVNGHTEKKGGLTYLSWAWAWAEVLKVDPFATWETVEYPNPDGTRHPCMWIGETAMVKTLVTINDKTKSCQLAVMDNRNNAVKNPDARKISDAIMRCMTKAVAMHGLGLYIYAGEDLPEGAPEPTSDAGLTPALEASIEQAQQKRKGVMEAVLADLDLDGPTRMGLEKLAARIKPMAPDAAYQTLEDNGLNNDEKTYLWSLLPSNVRSALKREGESRKVTA